MILATPIKLDDLRKGIIVNCLKPLLQKNDLLSVRKFLLKMYGGNSYKYDDYLGDLDEDEDDIFDAIGDIKLWLCNKLGEKQWFKDTDFTYCEEFFGLKQGILAVEIPSNVKCISDHAFDECNSLEDVKLNEGLEVIEQYAFAYTGIKKIVIPSTVKEIWGESFGGCNNLESIYLLGMGDIRISADILDSYHGMSPKCKIYIPNGKNMSWIDEPSKQAKIRKRIVYY